MLNSWNNEFNNTNVNNTNVNNTNVNNTNVLVLTDNVVDLSKNPFSN